MNAYVECACKTCKIEFLSGPKWTLSFYCACCDCREYLKFCEETKNGPKAPFEGAAQQTFLIPDNLKVVSGIDDLVIFKLKDEYPMDRMACRKCWTILIGSHPFFKGNFVVCPHPASCYNFQMPEKFYGIMYAKDFYDYAGKDKALKILGDLKKSYDEKHGTDIPIVDGCFEPAILGEWSALLSSTVTEETKKTFTGTNYWALQKRNGLHIMYDDSERHKKWQEYTEKTNTIGMALIGGGWKAKICANLTLAEIVKLLFAKVMAHRPIISVGVAAFIAWLSFFLKFKFLEDEAKND